MKKILSGSYYIVSLLGVLFVVGSFLFATNETHFRKGEIAGHQQITPQSITQVDEMTKEYIFSGEQFTGKNICLAFYSIHLGIEVYEDGELIYNLKPVPGIFWHNTRVCLEFSGDRSGLWAGHCEDTCCVRESGRRDPVFLYRRGSR